MTSSCASTVIFHSGWPTQPRSTTMSSLRENAASHAGARSSSSKESGRLFLQSFQLHVSLA